MVALFNKAFEYHEMLNNNIIKISFDITILLYNFYGFVQLQYTLKTGRAYNFIYNRHKSLSTTNHLPSKLKCANASLLNDVYLLSRGWSVCV